MQWIRSDRDEVIVAETADHDDRRSIPEFIAHARTDVPALVAEVKRLTAERDSLKGLLSGSQTELRSAVAAQRRAERERDEALAEVERLRNLWAAVAKDARDFAAEARGRREHGERLKAERDEVLAAIGFVRALADEWEQVITEGCFSADWTACLRANLPALRDALDGSGS